MEKEYMELVLIWLALGYLLTGAIVSVWAWLQPKDAPIEANAETVEGEPFDFDVTEVDRGEIR